MKKILLTFKPHTNVPLFCQNINDHQTYSLGGLVSKAEVIETPDLEGCKIPIEYVEKMIEERKRINSLDLSKIIWTKGGEPIEINPKVIKDFKFTGLNNIDFVATDFYLEGFQNNPKDPNG